MQRQPYFSDWKKIGKVSFGLVASFFYLFLLFHTKSYVPKGYEDMYWMVFVSYGILLAVSFGVPNIRNKLFNVRLVDFLPRFLLFGGISLLVFYYLLTDINPMGGQFFAFLGQVPMWLALIHAFVFATIESAVWQGFLDYELGHPWSELTAGVFHWGVWVGSALIVIPSAALLFAVFSLTNWYFRKSTSDLAPAIGVHTAFNIIKLGILFAVAGAVV